MRNVGFRTLGHASLLVIATASVGCKLDTRPINAVGSVAPQQFCPADTVTASFDFLRGETCPADVDCAAHFPNVNMSSAPAVFAPVAIRNYVGSQDFTPSGDRVDVTFDVDREAVLIPTDRFDGGSRVFIQRTNVRDNTVSTTRITGTIERELLHGGVCMGGRPMNASVELPGPPQMSANLRLTELCNASPVPVAVSLNTAAGATDRLSLSIGECLTPRLADPIRVVAIEALIPDVTARCGALDGAVPPQTLRTIARLACR